METIYLVVEAYRYKESKKWEYKLVGMFTNLPDAKKSLHSRMSNITKDSNDFSTCVIVDNWNNAVCGDFIDTHIDEPNSEE